MRNDQPTFKKRPTTSPIFLELVKVTISWEVHKIFEISTVDLSYVVLVKSRVEISQNFVAFSEYMNFKLRADLNEATSPY